MPEDFALAGPASTHANETGVGMVANCFALRDEGFCLLVGARPDRTHSRILVLQTAAVLQAADLFAGHRRKSRDAPVDHVLNGRVREADEFQGPVSFTAENVDLIRLG